MLLKGDKAAKLQTVKFEQLSGLLDSPSELTEVSVCSLRILEDVGDMVCAMISTPAPVGERNAILEELLRDYREIFNEPVGYPLPKAMTTPCHLKRGLNLSI